MGGLVLVEQDRWTYDMEIWHECGKNRQMTNRLGKSLENGAWYMDTDLTEGEAGVQFEDNLHGYLYYIL